MVRRNKLNAKGRRKLCKRYELFWEEYLKKYKPNEYKEYMNDLQYTDSQDKKCRKNQAIIDKLKAGCSCAICGYSEYPEALDFHHVNPEDKQFSLTANMLYNKDFGDELQKCTCLCANCHRHITRIEGRSKND